MGQELGKNSLPFIVAEISCNHEGKTEQAIKLVQSAINAGADAVKIQVYTADDMTLDIDTKDFRIENGVWNGNTLYELYSKAQTDIALANTIIQYCRNNDIKWFASVFSQKGLAFLEEMKCPAYKIASFEITDIPLIRRVAKTGKNLVLSTGMANLNDIDEAVLCCNPDNTALLHCVSAYPTKLEQANLWRIAWLQDLYLRSAIGFSDHTRGIIAGPLACAAGARIIEKHIALPDTNPEDAAFSLHPDEFKAYVQQCRVAALATFKVEVPEEQASRQFRRSIYAVKNIKEGDAFTPDNIRVIRPSYGLPANVYNRLIAGGKARCEIKEGTALTKDMVV